MRPHVAAPLAAFGAAASLRFSGATRRAGTRSLLRQRSKAATDALPPSKMRRSSTVRRCWMADTSTALSAAECALMSSSCSRHSHGRLVSFDGGGSRTCCTSETHDEDAVSVVASGAGTTRGLSVV